MSLPLAWPITLHYSGLVLLKLTENIYWQSTLSLLTLASGFGYQNEDFSISSKYIDRTKSASFPERGIVVLLLEDVDKGGEHDGAHTQQQEQQPQLLEV